MRKVRGPPLPTRIEKRRRPGFCSALANTLELGEAGRILVLPQTDELPVIVDRRSTQPAPDRLRGLRIVLVVTGISGPSAGEDLRIVVVAPSSLSARPEAPPSRRQQPHHHVVRQPAATLSRPAWADARSPGDPPALRYHARNDIDRFLGCTAMGLANHAQQVNPCTPQADVKIGQRSRTLAGSSAR